MVLSRLGSDHGLTCQWGADDHGPALPAPNVKPGRRHWPSTSFYVDCRLFRQSTHRSMVHSLNLGHDFECDKLLPGQEPPPGVFCNRRREQYNLFKQAVEAARTAKEAKDTVAQGKSTPVEPPPPLPVEYPNEPDYQKQCNQLYGLFDERILSDADTADELAANAPGGFKMVADVDDAFYPEGMYIYNHRQGNWFHCVITGEKGRAHLSCAPWETDPNDICKGFVTGKNANYSRWNFQSVCLRKTQSFVKDLVGPVGDMLTKAKVLYIGHSGEAQPLDIKGGPVDYGVYFMCAPPAFMVPTFPDRQARRRYKDFLAGPSPSEDEKMHP